MDTKDCKENTQPKVPYCSQVEEAQRICSGKVHVREGEEPGEEARARLKNFVVGTGTIAREKNRKKQF